MSVISHSASRIDTGIRHLDRTVQPFRAPRCQRIHRDHQIRLCLLYNAVNDLLRLHAGLRHHARHNAADPVHRLFAKCIFSILFHNMPRDKQIVHHSRSQCIRRHLTIPKSGNQHREALLL